MFWQRGPFFTFLIGDTVSVTTLGHQRHAIEFASKPMMAQHGMLSWQLCDSSVDLDQHCKRILYFCDFQGDPETPAPPSDTRMSTCSIFSTIQEGPWEHPQTSTKPYRTRLNRKLTSTYCIQSHDQDNQTFAHHAWASLSGRLIQVL